jgi:hypothetical protein
MQRSSTRWIAAEREHAKSVAAFLVAASLVPDEKWRVALGEGRWSPAQMALHIEQSYLLGIDALRGGPGMQLRRPRLLSWLGRTLMLPLMSLTRRFPRGVPSPPEVRPDAALAHAASREELTARVQSAATAMLTALREAVDDSRAARVTHAYLGSLDAYQTLQLLNAHTMHHATLLAPPKITGKSAPCVPEMEQLGV